MPGRLDSKDYQHLKLLAEDLNNIGFQTIRFDPTGTWNSGGDIADYCISQYLKDITDVIRYATDENGKPFDKIILCGHSMGGQVAMIYGVNDPAISAVIAIMSPASLAGERDVSSWESQGVKISKRDLPNDPESFHIYSLPYSFHRDRMKYDANKIISKFARPLLLMAGEEDKIITPEIIKHTYEMAVEPKKFTLIKGIGHDYRKYPKEIQQVNREIIDFLSSISK